MSTKQNKHPIDIDGSDLMSKLLLELLNTFPGLPKGKEIMFSTLQDTGGIGFFPTSGAAILSSKESITGHVEQTCLYPFMLVYRAAPKSQEQRMRIKELLDTIGKWLEQQTVTVNGEECKLESYPATNDSRKIETISRTSPGHLDKVYQDGIEDWALSATLRYKNEFYK